MGLFGGKTQVIECLLVGCKNHDGKYMACNCKKVEINADGFCSRFEQASNEELIKKGRGRISDA